jgi:3-oxoacyl-ACP reductase-like protein
VKKWLDGVVEDCAMFAVVVIPWLSKLGKYNDVIETGKVTGSDVTNGLTSAGGFESTSAGCSLVLAALWSEREPEKIMLQHVHVRKKTSDIDPTIRLYVVESTCVLLSCIHQIASTGISFAGKVALLTGCGKNSIGVEIVKSLLDGGATVFVTTSSFSMRTTTLLGETCEYHGSCGSHLIVLQLNQASKVAVQTWWCTL